MSTRSHLQVRMTLALASAVLCASPLFAQSQGRVIQDGAIIWRSEISVAAATTSAGTLLDITARSDRWYEVIIPEVLGGRGERGLIALSQVELLPGSPTPPLRPLRGSGPAERTPQPAVAQRAVTSARPFRGFMSVNGAYQMTSNDFGESVTIRENAEDGRLATDYVVRGGPAFDVSGGGIVWRRLGVGVGVSRFSRSIPAALNASIPHPFFFNRPRAVGAEISGMTREELAVHVQARALVPVSRDFQVMAFGGPSFFQVNQGVVTDFTYSDSYPYDEATFGTAQIASGKGSKMGFNAGVDASFFFARQIGVGGTVQFAGTTIELPSAGGGTQEVKAGGARAGGGLRLRF